MAHDLDHSTGKPAMAYVGTTPWHGLGEKLPPGQTIEQWAAAARLNWEIQTHPVQYQFAGKTCLMPNRFVLARSDTGNALSVMSGDYLVVQPKEILEFYRDLVEKRHYTLETAGALDGGRKVWALANTGLVANVANDPADKLGRYVLLATSCDGTLATTATFTSVRVVCQNTLNFAMQDLKKGDRRHVKIKHNQYFDATLIHKELGLIDASWDRFMGMVNPMAKHHLKDEDAKQFFRELFITTKQGEEPKQGEEHKPNAPDKKQVLHLLSIFKDAVGQQTKSAKSTVWGALNAVTYYVDHVKSTKSGDRLDSAWFGAGQALKAKAWELATALTNP